MGQVVTTSQYESASQEARVLIESAVAANLIDANWQSSADSPTNQEIHQAVGALKLGDANNSNLLKVLELMPRHVRPHAILGYLPSVTLGPPVVLRNKWDQWNGKFNSANGDHWLNLRNHLIDNLNWDLMRVEELDRTSDEVLFNLQDPDMSVQPRDPVKGLVVGYVQSGKTANYTATAAKAFDAGYRLVVVLAGVHNELRRQTQLRMENELGLVPSSGNRITSRAGGQAGLPNAITALTNEYSDRGYVSVDNSIVTNGRSIAVIKKNVAVMRTFLGWLPQDLKHPVLVIDDEADQASINSNIGTELVTLEDGTVATRKEERTATNKKIVELIGKYSPRVTYVGYTATPYANVFTDALDEENIYPRDFILSLPKPSGYFGPKEFFGDLTAGDESNTMPNSYSMVEIVSNKEADAFKQIAKLVRENRSQEKLAEPILVTVPDGLKRAIKTHLLAVCAFRAAKKGSSIDPTSMLVHVSHIQDVQTATRAAIEVFLKNLMTHWRYYRDQIEESVSGRTYLEVWKGLWGEISDNYGSPDFAQLTWSQIEIQLDYLMNFNVETICLNSNSTDTLDYEANPEFTGIVVGGNKLSRGLTLEGLLTSYFVRETSAPKADTLSQMGRFFGYRESYADLVKVFTTDSLLQDFKDISLIEEELREELALYSRIPGKTPADFGPRVALRGRLLPTANLGSANKDVSLSGSLLQTTQLINEVEEDWRRGANRRNSEFFQSLLEASSWKDKFVNHDNSRARWKGIPWAEISKLLDGFQFSSNSSRFNPELVKRYVHMQLTSERDEGSLGSDHSSWNVAVVGKVHSGDQGRPFTHADYSFELGQISRSLRVPESGDIGALINPLNVDTVSLKAHGDETIDLELDEDSVRELIADSALSKQMALRLKFRKNPLLCIYPIDPYSVGATKDRSSIPVGEALFGHDHSTWPNTILGLSIVFPRTNEESKGYMSGNAGRLEL